MIDATKVRMMTRLALYEQGQGKHDRAVYRCTKGVYLGIRRLISFFAITIAYMLASGLYCFRYVNEIFQKGFGYDYKPLVIRLALCYIIVLFFGLIVLELIYRRRYRKAMENLKDYDLALYKLDRYIENKSEQ